MCIRDSFNLPPVPKYLKIGFIRVSVSVYIPNLLRCYKCQRFGHGRNTCKGTSTCATCGQVGHTYNDCHNQPPTADLRRCLNKLQYWADTNGFRFSTSKTVFIHFCHLLKPHLDPQLSLNGMPIPVVEKTKFLGMILSLIHISEPTRPY